METVKGLDRTRDTERTELVRVPVNVLETMELVKDHDHMRDTETKGQEKLLVIVPGSVPVVQARLLCTDLDIALAARVTLHANGCNVAQEVLVRQLANDAGSGLEVRESVHDCWSHVVMAARATLLELLAVFSQPAEAIHREGWAVVSMMVPVREFPGSRLRTSS